LAKQEPQKEATLGEVLAEVNLADIGRMLKSGSMATGCLAVWLLLIFAFSAAGHAAGLDGTGVPDWLAWLLIAWFFAYVATSKKSYHRFNASWYFPKLGWFGSLVLAAYLVLFGYLLKWVGDIQERPDRTIGFALVYLVYLSPFLIFLSAITVGHAKLMDKRSAAAVDTRETEPFNAGEFG
jgi:hypothetical protein